MGMTTNQRNLDQWFHISNKSGERGKHAPVEYDLLALYVRLWLQYCLIPPVDEKKTYIYLIREDWHSFGILKSATKFSRFCSILVGQTSSRIGIYLVEQ